MSVKRVFQSVAFSTALLGASALQAQTTTPPAAQPGVAPPAAVSPPAPPPPAPPAPVTPPAAPKPATASGLPASLNVAVPRTRMSNRARLLDAEARIRRMRRFLTKSINLSASARRDKDVVRLNCVQEKVTALKALLRVAEQASVAVQEAASRNEAETADYELQRVRLASQKAQQMSAEANSCVGEVAVYTGPIQIEVETDPNLPRRDPTLAGEPVIRVDQFPIPNLLDRPQALSPPM